MRKFLASTALGAAILMAWAAPEARADSRDGFGEGAIRHVLLISIDGMHALDFINCAQGVSGVNGGAPYCPNLAALAQTGVNYLEAAASEPSDSFPGLMALVSGGSPRTAGAFYDVAYDRSLDPPATTTGNGVFGAPNLCTSDAPPMGTRTEFDEGIDIDQTLLNGGAPAGMDGGIASIDPDDYYSPEINSIPVALPSVPGCNPLPDQTAVSSSNAWTDSFANIQCYDSLKVRRS